MIAVIPARGGSKRILRKNIKPFLGIPIILRTINQLAESQLFSRLIVSTEDLEIANISKKAGAEILIRDPRLADDFATTQEVIKNSILQIGNTIEIESELVCCIYPVTPLLNTKYISKARELLIVDELDFVFTAKLSDPGVDR